MSDLELWQLTFDGAEVVYEEAIPPDPAPLPAFKMRRKSNRVPRGQEHLFDPTELDPRDTIL